jgi:hypothetical protein
MGWPPITQKITVTGFTTANGSSYGTAYFPPGRQVAQCEFTNPSTGDVDFMLQGSNSTSAIWFDLLAAPSTVTTGATVRVVSTAVFVFDRVRVETTDASASTKSATYVWWVTAR